jgi:hypothetical protein
MIYVIKTEAMEKYLNLPVMISEATGEKMKIVEHYKLPESGKIWHYYFLDRDSSIKPDRKVAYKWDDKLFQYGQFEDKMNIPDYDIYNNSISLIANLSNIKRKYGRFMITQAHGFYGKEYLYGDETINPEIILKKYGVNEKLRVSQFIDNAQSISLHLIVGEDFFVSPLTYQRIERITLYRGGSYPCFSRAAFYDYCSIINEALMKDGYFGLAHIDFLYTDNGIYFGEINPRIAGSTPYMCYSLEQEYGINMPYLEYEACLTGKVPTVNNSKRCNVEWDFHIFDEKANSYNLYHIDIRKAFNKTGEYIIPFDGEKHIKLVIKNDKRNNI